MVRVLYVGLCVLMCAAVCSSNVDIRPGSPPAVPLVEVAFPAKQGEEPIALRYAPAKRAANAAPAIIEEVCEKYLKPGVKNLAAGFSYWAPPDECIKEAQKLLTENSMELHRYGSCLGLPELCEMLKKKLKKENNIIGREVMVTAGANMAFVHAATCLCSPGESAILFTPYYFSHRVALELQGIRPMYVECDEDMVPSAINLKSALESAKRQGIVVKMVTVVTPGNPSGVVIPQQRLQELIKVCSEYAVWLISDETYEYFTYDGAVHASPNNNEGVINIFSLSKSYGLAGWRVGYLAYPPSLHQVMLKVQDTIVTNCPIISQKIALAALRVGPDWVRDKVRTIYI
jgi:aspartate/methionine/tyrosine aminotransferase